MTSTTSLPSNSATPKLPDFPYPFNNPKADVVFQSSDGVKFRYFKLILTLTSPFFEDMFSLPQPSDPQSQDLSNPVDSPIIPVSEDSCTLFILLSMVHPGNGFPSPENLQDIDLQHRGRILFFLGEKYQISSIRTHGAFFILRGMRSQPLRAYAFAVKLQFPYEILEAARLSLRFDNPYQNSPVEDVVETEAISVTNYQHLLNYRERCAIAASAVALDANWCSIDPNNIHPFWIEYNGEHTCGMNKTHVVVAKFITARRSQWWCTFMQDAADALMQRPCKQALYEGDMIKNAQNAMLHCHFCRRLMFPYWHTFLDKFGEAIEEAVNKVVLEVQF